MISILLLQSSLNVFPDTASHRALIVIKKRVHQEKKFHTLWGMKTYRFTLSCLLLGLSVLLSSSVIAEQKEEKPEVSKAKESEDHSFLVGAALYVPNRVLDLLDIFRLRVRVGPGVAAGVRATEVASAYAGTYASVYAGLPGPRLRQTPKLPVGLESHNGVSASVFDATADGGMGPDYSSTEFGGGVQAGILGLDFGIDPVEIADFVAGIFTLDIREDDL
jgi:hypothetical protein